MAKTTFIAAGDAFITRRFPEGGYEGFGPVRDCVMQHDVRFVNLEMTFHNQEGVPAAVSGGTWAMADPRTLDDIRSYGFNLFNIPYVARKANHVAVCSYQLPEYIRGVVVDGEFPYHHLIRRVSHNSIDIPDGRIRVYILRIQCCQ